MADLADIMGGEFRPQEEESSTVFEPLPPGNYSVTIDKTEIKETKAGDGHYLALTLCVFDHPEHDNRQIRANVNLRNPNSQAQQIGRRELAAIGQALGLASLTDAAQLVGGALVVKVAVKNSAEYGPQNEVKGWMALNATNPTPARHKAAGHNRATLDSTHQQVETARNGMAQVRTAAPAATTSTPPWKR